jgi:hypothetical protein
MANIETKALIDSNPSVKPLMDKDVTFKSLIENDAQFRSLVAKFGVPKKVADCTELNENDICMQTECYQGQRIVMRCNGAGACDRYSEEACP